MCASSAPAATASSTPSFSTRAVSRPSRAIASCERGSPALCTEEGFREFNEIYAAKLKLWGLYDGKVNPVARSNVCPALNPPREPSLHAFCYTDVDGGEKNGGFIVAGSGEAPERKLNYRDFIVRRGDVSPAGLREKACFVLGIMEAASRRG